MTRYAAETTVPQEQSRAEIEKILRRYRADAFYYASEGRRSMIGFRMANRQIRFVLTMPDPEDREFTMHSRGRRTPEASEKLWEQACRANWRALALVIKAKLEAVTAGITTVEDEFLSHTVLPDNTTVGDWARGEIDRVYLTGGMPASLLLEGPR